MVTSSSGPRDLRFLGLASLSMGWAGRQATYLVASEGPCRVDCSPPWLVESVLVKFCADVVSCGTAFLVLHL